MILKKQLAIQKEDQVKSFLLEEGFKDLYTKALLAIILMLL